MNGPHPYSALTPDVVVSAVEALGHRCDGRILALYSYENRVYQVGREDSTPVVVKFYRPERWPAAILEEHEFALELARGDPGHRARRPADAVSLNTKDSVTPLSREVGAGELGRTTAADGSLPARIHANGAPHVSHRPPRLACWGRRRPIICSTPADPSHLKGLRIAGRRTLSLVEQGLTMPLSALRLRRLPR
jgi:hypothetical protein